jgi:protein-tyrosine-phosphatase
MAEGFANRYGKDVMVALSAGLAPTGSVTPETVAVMRERNVDVLSHVPSVYDPREAAECDLIINLAGIRLTGVPPKKLVEWKVTDPFGGSIELYRSVRDELEQRVMRLILDLRLQATKESVRR